MSLRRPTDLGGWHWFSPPPDVRIVVVFARESGKGDKFIFSSNFRKEKQQKINPSPFLSVLLQGEPTEAFEWFKVDRAVGNVRNQGAELIEPL